MSHVHGDHDVQRHDSATVSSLVRDRLGVCTLSLPSEDPTALLARLAQTGVGGVQLAFDLLHDARMDRTALLAGLSELPVRLLSGVMVLDTELQAPLEPGVLVPDDRWLDTLKAAERNAASADDLGLPQVAIRLGARWDTPTSEHRRVLLQRLRRLAAPFTGRGIEVALHTGPQSVDATLGLLMELDTPDIGVSFDPAEMVRRRTGDPVEALDLLSPHVRQIRVRDAESPDPAGHPGAEVAVGDGVVDWDALFQVVRSRDIDGPLLIVRESGHHRMRDIRAAAALIRAHGMDT